MSTTHPPVADGGDTTTDSGIPDFEGQSVEQARLKLTSVTNLEIEAAHRMDDVVRMFVEGRVVRIDHVVGESGQMRRVHTIKVVEAIPLPWDFDTGAFDA